MMIPIQNRREKSLRVMSIPNATSYAKGKSCKDHGVPFLHDKDTVFLSQVQQRKRNAMTKCESTEMPEIQTIGPSFYFQTFSKGPKSHLPVISRAWNDTYAVTDHPLFTGEVWGRDGLNDDFIRKAMDAGDFYILPPLKYATFSGWIIGNYAHYMHDHLSKIAWLKSQVTSDTIFLLPYHELHKNILSVVDKTFVNERVIWVDYGKTFHVSEGGSLTVMTPKGHGRQHGTKFNEHLRQWLVESHWDKSHSPSFAENKRKVVYYMRRGGTLRRNIQPDLEEELLKTIRDTMIKHGRNPNDLIIFNGKDVNGQTLSVQKQFEIFSSADIAIGVHGSGLSNIVWMDPRCDQHPKVKVLEILSSWRTPDIQFGKIIGNWLPLGTVPWIDFHNMFYSAGSTDKSILIDKELFEQVLNSLFSDENLIAIHQSPSLR